MRPQTRGPAGRSRLGALVGVLLLAIAAYGCGADQPEFAFRIDYEAVAADGRAPSADEFDAIFAIVVRRLEATGIATLRVTAKAPERIVVEAAPLSVLDEVRALVGTTGRVDFVPLGQTPAETGQRLDLEAHPPLFSSDQVETATVGADQTGQPTVDITLKPAGRDLFAAWTAGHVGESFAIVLDGEVLAAPVVREAIPGGQVQISLAGDPVRTASRVQELVIMLSSGALPFPLRQVPASEP